MSRLLLIIAAPMLAAGSAAQETTGEVSGRVLTSVATDVSAHVTATGISVIMIRSAVTSGRGEYRLLALSPGMYRVRITAVGFRPIQIDSVRVVLGRTTGLRDATLEPVAA